MNNNLGSSKKCVTPKLPIFEHLPIIGKGSSSKYGTRAWWVGGPNFLTKCYDTTAWPVGLRASRNVASCTKGLRKISVLKGKKHTVETRLNEEFFFSQYFVTRKTLHCCMNGMHVFIYNYNLLCVFSLLTALIFFSLSSVEIFLTLHPHDRQSFVIF